MPSTTFCNSDNMCVAPIERADVDNTNHGMNVIGRRTATALNVNDGAISKLAAAWAVTRCERHMPCGRFMFCLRATVLLSLARLVVIALVTFISLSTFRAARQHAPVRPPKLSLHDINVAPSDSSSCAQSAGLHTAPRCYNASDTRSGQAARIRAEWHRTSTGFCDYAARLRRSPLCCRPFWRQAHPIS